MKKMMKRYRVEVRVEKLFNIKVDAYDEEDAAEIVEAIESEDIEAHGEWLTTSLPEAVFVERIYNED